jgi:dTDP-4-dehydrorhamnose 3,5-epimerase
MTNIRSQSVLDGTISAATRDAATVSPDGSRLQRLTHGVTIRRLVTQTDSRGTVTELFDQRWREQEPLVFCYSFTIRPGVAKGWSLHRRHQDCYALLRGGNGANPVRSPS